MWNSCQCRSAHSTCLVNSPRYSLQLCIFPPKQIRLLQQAKFLSQCHLKHHISYWEILINFYQFVTCTTRKVKTLDLCYGTVKGAYKSIWLPPLGIADHKCVLLLPAYKTVLKSEKIQTKEVKIWSDESTACLQGCFDCTDWEMFKDSCTDIDELTDVICSYDFL
ncbi:hypothetical protein N1851_013150 [Merluccius polli]|uniref:Uncharacterized protein n=1 Tax=Merluccius polli TaxID=89951 RepID=A0AA47MVJ0_MERPO|nr:hypothetical protein N1851_013150 [Merluccius polli]